MLGRVFCFLRFETQSTDFNLMLVLFFLTAFFMSSPLGPKRLQALMLALLFSRSLGVASLGSSWILKIGGRTQFLLLLFGVILMSSYSLFSCRGYFWIWFGADSIVALSDF